MGVMSNSWFIVVFNLVNGFAANAEVIVWQFLDCYCEELLRNMRIREALCFAKNLGCCCCKTLYQLFLLFSDLPSALY